MAVDADRGTAYRLRTGPVPGAFLTGMYPSSDGALWAAYQAGAAPAVIARSVDRGASWHSWTVPADTSVGGIAARSRTEAFALLEPAAKPGSGNARLFRTRDGGRTWRDVGTDLPASVQYRPFAVAADGSLLVVDGPGAQQGPDCTQRCDQGHRYVWRSRDGRHFEPGPPVSGQHAGAGAGAGFVWIMQQDSGGTALRSTADGVTWRPLRLPD
jgi:hypothetical protein